MKNIIKKIGGLCLGLAMLSGVAVGISTNKISEVRAAGSYTKASSITVGDKVVLVCETAGMELTSISTTSTKYGIGTAFSGSPSGTFVFDVETGSETGSFSFKNGSNYLRWNSGNSLDTVATSVAKNSSWFVTFDGSNNAQLTNANDATRFILWNKSSPRFATYAGQSVGDAYSATQLYKEGSTPTKELVSLTVSGTLSKTSYNVGETLNPDGLVVTGTYNDKSTETITSGIEWTFDPDPFSLGDTTCDVMASVGDVDSNVYTVEEITVTEFVGDYEKVTSAPTDWSGEYLLVFEPDSSHARVWTGVDAANCYVETSIINSQIVKPTGTTLVEITQIDGGYSIKILNGDKSGNYISGKSNTNTIEYSVTAVANTITFNENNGVLIESNSTYFCYNKTSGNDRFRYYKSTTTGTNYILPFLYKKTDSSIVSDFVDNYMHMTDYYPEHQQGVAGDNLCLGTDGYYMTAKAALVDLTPSQIELFKTDAAFSDAKARYEDWARANNDATPYSESVTPMNSGIGLIGETNTSTWIIVAVSLAGLTAIGGYFFYKKRKENF